MGFHHQTKAQVAADALRDMIQRGELPPGAMINIESLSARLGMSATPIREALRSLVAEGLAAGEPHRRMRVAAFSADEVSAACDLRALLESYATRLAVPKLGEQDIRQLERLAELRRNAVARHDIRASIRLNRDWHFRIYRRADDQSPLLQEFIERLWNGFPWTTAWTVPGRAARSVLDHVDIMAAIKDGDAMRASDLMDAHIRRGRDLVIEHLRQAGRDREENPTGGAGPASSLKARRAIVRAR